MRDEELATLLRSWVESVDPPPETVNRMRAVARRVVAETAQERERGRVARRWPKRRLVMVLVSVLAILLLTSVIALAVQLVSGGGESLPVRPEARAALHESAVLGRAPWIYQHRGAPRLQEVPRAPSLVYPQGTSYGKAISQLYRSVALTGTLPSGTRLAAPLGPGVVWRVGRGVYPPALDLTAPFGYTIPAGVIRAPSLMIPASVPAAVAERFAQALRTEGFPKDPLASKVVVDVPSLASCQVQVPGRDTNTCRLSRLHPAG